MNPLIVEIMIKEKHQEMLKEAERQQLVAIYNTNNPGWGTRFQIAFGDFLILLGEKIKRRYTHRVDLDDDLCRE